MKRIIAVILIVLLGTLFATSSVLVGAFFNKLAG